MGNIIILTFNGQLCHISFFILLSCPHQYENILVSSSLQIQFHTTTRKTSKIQKKRFDAASGKKNHISIGFDANDNRPEFPRVFTTYCKKNMYLFKFKPQKLRRRLHSLYCTWQLSYRLDMLFRFVMNTRTSFYYVWFLVFLALTMSGVLCPHLSVDHGQSGVLCPHLSMVHGNTCPA